MPWHSLSPIDASHPDVGHLPPLKASAKASDDNNLKAEHYTMIIQNLNAFQSPESEDDDIKVPREIRAPRSPTMVNEFDADFGPFEEMFPTQDNPFRRVTAVEERQEEEITFETDIDGPMTARPANINTNMQVEIQVSQTVSPNSSGIQEDVLSSQEPAAESSIEVVHTPSTPPPASRSESPLQADVIEPTADTENKISFRDAITSKLRLYIDDYDSAFFTKLMYDLMSQSSITKLDIHRGIGKARRRNAKEMALFFLMVQSLESLQTLHLSNIDASVDLLSFHEALYGHPKLEFVRLHVSSGVIDRMTLHTLTTIPKLSDVTFETSESVDFSFLLHSNSIQKLRILASEPHYFENTHLMPLVKMLERNTTLKELHLEPTMEFMVYKYLVYALRVNKSLEAFRVALEPEPTEALLDQSIGEICRVLQMNHTLRELYNLNYSTVTISMVSKRQVLKALETNTALENFVFFNEDASFASSKVEALNLKMASGVSPRNLYSSGLLDTPSDVSVTCSTTNAPTSRPTPPEQPKSKNFLFCNAAEPLDVASVVSESREAAKHASEQLKPILSDARQKGEQLKELLPEPQTVLDKTVNVLAETHGFLSGAVQQVAAATEGFSRSLAKAMAKARKKRQENLRKRQQRRRQRTMTTESQDGDETDDDYSDAAGSHGSQSTMKTNNISLTSSVG